MTGSGQAPAAKTDGLHPEVAAVFLHHNVGGDLRGSEDRVRAGVDRHLEHFTPDIRRMYHVNFANGVLRHRLGFSNLQQEIRGAGYWGKLGLGLAYKALGMHKRRRKRLAIDFRVDPSAPRGVRDIPAYQFQE
jgi:hypothetical protein